MSAMHGDRVVVDLPDEVPVSSLRAIRRRVHSNSATTLSGSRRSTPTKDCLRLGRRRTRRAHPGTLRAHRPGRFAFDREFQRPDTRTFVLAPAVTKGDPFGPESEVPRIEIGGPQSLGREDGGAGHDRPEVGEGEVQIGIQFGLTLDGDVHGHAVPRPRGINRWQSVGSLQCRSLPPRASIGPVHDGLGPNATGKEFSVSRAMVTDLNSVPGVSLHRPPSVDLPAISPRCRLVRWTAP